GLRKPLPPARLLPCRRACAPLQDADPRSAPVPDCLPQSAAWSGTRWNRPPPPRGQSLHRCGGICRQQYLGALEFAGGPFALAQHRGEFTAFGLAQFDPITYIHPDLLVGGPDESTNESKIRRRSQPQRSRFHRKARPVPGLHLHLLAHLPMPARRDRYAAPLSSQPTLGPPDDRHARTKWPHSASTRRRPKHPNPR